MLCSWRMKIASMILDICGIKFSLGFFFSDSIRSAVVFLCNRNFAWRRVHAFPIAEFTCANDVDGMEVPPALAANTWCTITEVTVDIVHRAANRCDVGAMCIEKIHTLHALVVQTVDNILDQAQLRGDERPPAAEEEASHT